MSDARLAGVLLIVAALFLSLIGATLPTLNRTRVWMLPLPEYLRVIRAHEREWRAHAWLFALGAVTMALALAFLARALTSPFALAAAALYLCVAPLWLAVLAFRLDFTVWASREEPRASLFDAIGQWTGSLYVVFMVGGFFSVALLGAALVDGALVPPWTAWALVALGTGAGISHWASWPRVFGMRSPFDLPVLVQLFPLFVAIPLAAAG